MVDHYLWALPFKANRFISQQALTTAELTVKAVEKYQATAEMLHASKKELRSASLLPTGGRQKNPKVFNPATSGARYAPGGARSQPGPGGLHHESETRQCYRCREMGHIPWQFEKLVDKPMPTTESSSSPPTHLFASIVGVTDGTPE